MAKESGVDIPDDEIKGKRLEDVVAIAFAKTKDTFGNKISELEKAAGTGKDELVKEWETKFDKLNKKHGELDQLHKGLQTTYEHEKSGWQGQIKNIKLENLLSKKHENIKWSTAAKPLEKEGFFAHLKNNYTVDLDETGGSLELFDKSGKRIPNPAKAGTWKTYDDILPEDGLRLGIWEQNPHKQTPFQKNIITTEPHQQNGNGMLPGQVRRVSSKVKI